MTDTQRILKFTAYNLGKRVKLLLMFQPPKAAGTLYEDVFPLAWKVVELAERGGSEGIATWNADTAFFVPSIEPGSLIDATNYKNCATGQQCTITSDGEMSTLASAVDGDANILKCKNLSGSLSNIGIGFTDEDGENIQPALMWIGVANEDSVIAQLVPNLRIYASHDYQREQLSHLPEKFDRDPETEIIQGEADSPLLWSGNLLALKPETVFKVSIDPGSGELRVVPQKLVLEM